MIDHLNALLRHLLLTKSDSLSEEQQIGFQPPDDEWKSYVSNLTTSGGDPANAVNIYLFDLRENTVLRSNELIRTVSEGWVTETPAPRRLDCHYLITAWSPAAVTPSVEPTLDEHALLYEALAVLMDHDPLVPAEIYAPDPLPPGTPEALAGSELPVQVLPPEGFPKYAEFWGTMGADQRWRPAIQLVVTLPVLLSDLAAAPIVTTRLSHYRIGEDGIDAGTSIQIGGHVLDATSPAPDGSPSAVEDAWVEIETLAGERLKTTRTNSLGEFEFGELRPGDWPDGPPDTYRLRVRLPGYSDVTREIEMPSPSGEYDLLFE